MNQELFNQDEIDEADFVKVDLLPPRPRDPRSRAYQQVSEERRRFVLERHTQQTIDRASAALAGHTAADSPLGLPSWKFGGQLEALRILRDAAAKYERLGGSTELWAIFGGRR